MGNWVAEITYQRMYKYVTGQTLDQVIYITGHWVSGFQNIHTRMQDKYIKLPNKDTIPKISLTWRMLATGYRYRKCRCKKTE
jgi:hypothetical protein